VNRLALILLVGVLTTSASGMVDLVLPEQCSLTESDAAVPDGACPPSCARCHCTGASDLVARLEVVDTPLLSQDWLAPTCAIPQSIPGDILHVPKPTLS
jgi:hypothetical protein